MINKLKDFTNKNVFIKILIIMLINAVLLSGFFTQAKATSNTSIGVEKIIKQSISEYHLENFEEALVLFKKAYKLNPNVSLISYYLGLCYKELGQYNKALKYFEKASNMKPPIENAYLEAAYILYNFKKFDKALKYLKMAEKSRIDLKTVYQLENSILSKQRKYEQQITLLKKMKKLIPNDSLYIDLQTGIVYLKERELKKASNIFKNIISDAPQSKEAKESKILLSKIKNLYKKWKYFSATLSLGTMYDTNVVSKPFEKTGLSTVDEISKTKDASMGTSISLNYRSFPHKYFKLTAGAFFSSQNYSKIKSYSYKTTGAYVTPVWSSVRFPIEAGLNIYGTYFWLNNKKYMRNYSLSPFLNWNVTRKTSFNVSVGYAKRKMLNISSSSSEAEDRSGSIYTINFIVKKQLFSPKFHLTLGVGGKKENTKGINWDSKALMLYMKNSYDFNKRISSSISIYYQYLKFLHDNLYSGEGIPGFPAYKTKRRDKIFNVTAGLNVKLRKRVTLRVFNTYFINSSNFKIYDYRRNITGVILSYEIY